MSAPSVPERFYRTILRAAPASFRKAHGADIALLFRELYREALRTGGITAAMRIWLRSTVSLVVCVFAEHWEERRSRNGKETGSQWSQKMPQRRRDLPSMIDGAKQDLSFALRTILRTPGFALAVVLILGVGIGATTTIFSVVDTVVLRPLPYPDPEELVFVDNGSHTVPDFIEWRDNIEAFGAIGAAQDGEASLTGDGQPTNLRTVGVTEDFLPMLGAIPHLGRLFMEDDFVGDASVVLLDHGFWQRRWGSDPSVIGRQISLSGRPAVIAGVLNSSFQSPAIVVGNQVDIWYPLDVDDPERQQRNRRILGVTARLRRGVGPEVAQAEMDAIMAGIAQEFPEQYIRRDGSIRSFPVIPLHEATVQQVSSILYVLLGAVGFMLLIACANTANLFLARGTTRIREISLRGALGASRGRILGQLLTESSLLGLVGGALGVALAFGGVHVFFLYDTGRIPRLEGLAVDTRILLFALVASVGTGILCGIFPALQAIRRDVNDGLREGSSNATVGRGRRRARSVLVVSEIALTLILLTGSGLLFRSLIGMITVDPGFQTEDLITIPLSLEGENSSQGGGYTPESRAQFVRDLTERLEGLPGVQVAAAGWSLPFVSAGGSRCCWGDEVVLEGGAEGDTEEPITWVHPVTERYFEALGAPLAHGREFTSADAATDPDVAIVNAPLARHLFGRTDVVGERVLLGEDDVLTVVGVAEGVHQYGLDQGVEFGIYLPYATSGAWVGMLHLAVRSSVDVGTLAPSIREVIWAIDSDLPIDEIITMQQRVDQSLAAPRFLSILFGFFAGVALLLACGGIYASMLYTVGQRRREMGIRLALGAEGGRLIRMVLSHGLTLTLLGIGLGLAGAFGLTRFLESIVWGITTTDPLTFCVVSILLASVAVVACLLPARRASRADPLETLKAE